MLNNEIRIPLRHFWTHDRGLSFFLGFLVLMVFFLPLAGLHPILTALVNLVFFFTLISGAIVTSRSPAVTAVIVTLVLANVAIHWAGVYVASFRHLVIDTVLTLLCLLIFIVVTLRQVFRPGPVTLHRILGAVAGYLPVALTWAFAYRLLDEEIPGAIHLARTSPGAVETLMAPYIYFSFCTLTSVGYGEIYPVHPIARSLAMFEALLGQLYPAILIAALVGMALQSRSQKETS